MFNPTYSITPELVTILMQIAALKEDIEHAPISPTVLAHLRATARMSTVHYSTQIEGNRLTLEQIEEAIKKGGSFANSRDEKEALGYFAALNEVDRLAQRTLIMEADIKMLHAIVMGGGQKKIVSTPYRDGQNIIKDTATRSIVYLPPETKDAPGLMQELVDWINNALKQAVPAPLIAGIAHYQFVTIHPYYDGNGRTARLLSTLILHQSGYSLKGIYCLEEYYAKNLPAYYQAMTIGPSHNYYFGRAEADISPWLDYFCRSMLMSFERVKRTVFEHQAISKNKDLSPQLRTLDAFQRALISLFAYQPVLTAKEVEIFFKLKPRTARSLCQRLAAEGFFVITNSSRKKRAYSLSPYYKDFI